MEFPFKRPSWLRWQKERLSLWLHVYLVVTIIPVALIPILIEQHRLGSAFKTAFDAWVDQLAKRGPTTYDYFLSAAILILLGWYTYFSKSPRVKESDKFYVFLLFCIGTLGTVQQVLIHHFIR